MEPTINTTHDAAAVNAAAPNRPSMFQAFAERIVTAVRTMRANYVSEGEANAMIREKRQEAAKRR
jgi:hypothetical protein